MTSKNGRLTEKQLVHIAAGEQLATVTARAWRHLIIEGHRQGITITLAGSGIGSAYRSLAVQQDFYDAYHGDVVAAARVHLNPSSRIPVAYPGWSSHGWGTRADMLFNGSASPTSVELNLCKRFGWTREFGSADPNHFMHDGRTAIKPLSKADCVNARIFPYEHGDTSAPQHLAQVAASPAFVNAVDGDSLSVIAAKHHLTLPEIERLNPQVKGPAYVIEVGQKIRVR